jgi:pimeloyl-ACP methyl ester carboxylesterase
MAVSLKLLSLLILVALGVLALALWRRRRNRRRPEPAVAKTVERALGAAGAWLKGHPEIEPRYAEFQGEKVYYVQTGQGPDLVLLHGIGASLFIWRFVIPALARKYRVTALDIPGFGRSGKEAHADYGLDAQRKRVNLFLDTLHIQKAYLVGSSMGGAIALWMSHESPRRYPKVAVLAPATSPELIPKRFSKALAFAPFAHRTLNRRTMKLILSFVLAKHELIDSDTIEAYLEPFLDNGISLRTFLGALQLLGDRRMPKCFADIQSEVLIIQGDRDRLVPMRSIQRLMKILRTAELVTSPGAGHHIMEDEPAWTANEILRFLAR